MQKNTKEYHRPILLRESYSPPLPYLGPRFSLTVNALRSFNSYPFSDGTMIMLPILGPGHRRRASSRLLDVPPHFALTDLKELSTVLKPRQLSASGELHGLEMT